MESIEKIIKVIKKRSHESFIVVIDGLAGVGKSTLSEKLQQSEPSIQIVSLDAFFLPLKNRTAYHPGKLVYEEYDLKRLSDEVLIPYKNGITGFYRTYNWVTDKIENKKYEIVPLKPLIVDGTSSFYLELISKLQFDFRVWVTAPEEMRIARAKKRDDELAKKSGGYSDKTKNYFEKEWLPMEKNYYTTYSPDKKADIIIDL